MLNIFPYPYPDELFYSWFGRYRKMCGYKSPIDSMIDLFNKRNYYPNIWYPTNLNFLIKQLPNEWKITANDIIEKYTVFPFFKIFLDENAISKALSGMTYNNKINLLDMIGIPRNSIINLNSIKLCLKCCEEDLRGFGETYIHRIHQVPGYLMCLKHRCHLNELLIPNIVPRNDFIDINYFINYSNKINIYGFEKEIEQLSIDIEYIINNNFSSVDKKVVESKIICKLKNDLYMCTKNIKQTKLIDGFLKRFDLNFLGIFISEISDKKIIRLINNLTTNSKVGIHPIMYILLIRFLFGSIQDFFGYNDNQTLLTDKTQLYSNINKMQDNLDGVNIFSKVSNLKTNIINVSSDIHSVTNRNEEVDINNFNNRNDYKHMTKYEIDNKWKNIFSDLVLSKKYTINHIAKILNCSSRKVLRRAFELGIPSRLLLNDVNEQNKCIYKDEDSELKIYKNRIIEYLQCNKEARRSQIKSELLKEYCYVFKKDRLWIEDNLLPAWSCKPKIVEKDWNKLDSEICQKVVNAIDKILASEKLTRVTCFSISREISYGEIRKKNVLNRMPVTKSIIDSNIETLEEFKRRRIESAIKGLKASGKKINKSNIKMKVNFGKNEYELFEPFVKILIEKYTD